MRKNETQDEYDARMNALSMRISNVIDGERLPEATFALMALAAFALKEIPDAEERDETKQLALKMFKRVLEQQ